MTNSKRRSEAALLEVDEVQERPHSAYSGPLFETLNDSSSQQTPLNATQTHEPQKIFTVVSMFSGAGGMDLGFRGNFTFLGRHYEQNPYKIVWANELNAKACATYRANLDEGIHEGDVWEYLHSLPESADLVIGGFPCQDISVNGKGAGIQGLRSGLYRAMVEAVKRVRPSVFVVENVRALTHGNHTESFNQITEDFAALGYNVTHSLYNAANYEVPQTRERVFIVGRLPSVKPFEKPVPALGQESWITAEEAIGDLEGWERNPENNHVWSLAAVSPDQGNRKLVASRPGYTVRAEWHGNSHFHYKLLRRMSMREAARIQSFPDDFIFKAALRESERQIGNAVPPVLAWHIARAVSNCLNGENEIRSNSDASL